MATLSFHDSVLQSLTNLCRFNNGMFKSDKQAKLLLKFLEENDGLCGRTDAGTPIFAEEWDDKGIIKTHKKLKSGFVTVFLREVAGTLNAFQIKELKALKKSLVAMEAGLIEKEWLDNKYKTEFEKLEIERKLIINIENTKLQIASLETGCEVKLISTLLEDSFTDLELFAIARKYVLAGNSEYVRPYFDKAIESGDYELAASMVIGVAYGESQSLKNETLVMSLAKFSTRGLLLEENGDLYESTQYKLVNKLGAIENNCFHLHGESNIYEGGKLKHSQWYVKGVQEGFSVIITNSGKYLVSLYCNNVKVM